MKHRQDSLTIRHLASLASAAAFLLLVSIPAWAQQRTSASAPKPPGRESSVGYEQDLRLRGAMRGAQPQTDAELREILKQINEDFERIQVVNDNLLGMIRANSELNYKSIIDMTGEIRKRAKRFKENTNLPAPADDPAERKKPEDIAQAEMKDALSMLNNRINSFVDNPLFQTPVWTDAVQGAKASRDLEVIIEMSAQIKKKAERLSKSPQ
ncbi:MAG TPA: hypothetical protein VF553_13375 [Pyrinomonadaceae bacterium]|jgi:hypothetical protein